MNLFQLLKQAPAKNRKLKKFNNRIAAHSALALISIVLTVVLIFPMAAAWYSNVVEVGSVQFQADPWGFKGTVSVSNDLITAAPGDSGVVTMSVTNPSDSVIAMTVGANKTTMPVEMRQRIYFYVDAAQIINEETVQRTYLNATSGYDYTLMPGRDLNMSEEYSNVTPVYWMWVYDMLGYYVQGSWDTNGQFVATEYLRPVEYDYDTAVYDADGNLAYVDGTTPVADFVASLTAADGYAGQGVAVAALPGWYMIDVDEYGRGVWLYLCSQSEIAAANAYDTNLGEAAYEQINDADPDTNPAIYTASVFVTGQQKELVTQQAGTSEELKNALQSGTVDRIELSADTSLSEKLVIPAGSDVILDLNGHQLTTSSGDLLEAEEGTTLIVANGEMVGDGNSYAIRAIGADVTMDNVTFTNVQRAISVYDNNGTGADSQVRMTGCTVNSESYGVVVMGNGEQSSGRTLLVIEDTQIIAPIYAISGNGNKTHGGVEIVVKNSTLISTEGAAIYHPQRNSVMTLIDSELIGWTGMIIKNGTVNVQNCKITGQGDAFDPVEGSSSGSANTGDGIYMECNYSWATIVVNISGNSEITSTNNAAIRKFEAAATNGDFVITGGTFVGVEAVDLTGYVPEGYTITDNNTTNVQVKADDTAGQ